ncbi:hypothetical protein [Patiriisocius sp. Uisw_017]|uniref:hypothetical protein n=1 Tax=Patiriisocius sp. Uisw_017 TaxID=3230968 RepID=UPI0039E867C4
MINKHIFAFVFLLFPILIFGQCNYNTNRVYDVTVKQFEPSLVAYDENYQIGAALGKVKKDIILTILIRFNGNAKEIGSDLLVFTDGKEAVNLEYIDSQKDYMAGSEISLNKFKIKENQFQHIKNQQLKTFRFKFANEEINRTFQIEKNKTVISAQLKCFTSN